MIILKVLIIGALILLESFCISCLYIIVSNLINKSNISFKNKMQFLKFWAITFLIFVVNHLIDFFIPSIKWVKPFSFMLLTSLNSFIIYKTNYYKNIIVSVLLLALSAILEIVTVLILRGFDIDSAKMVNNAIQSNMYACAIAIIELLIGITILNFNKALSSVENKLTYFIPHLIAIVICLFPTMILFLFNYFKYSALLIAINLLQLLVISFVGIYNLRFVVKHENTEVELANTITYNETLKKVNDGVRGFKHDMGNIVQSILGYIALNDSEGAKNYCQNLVIGFNDINILSILSPTVIDDPAIYGVVVNKILQAREKEMTLSLDINLEVSKINFPKFDLSRIIGILLDNAIEAGEQTNDKKLIVNMYHDFSKDCNVIIISNSIKDTNIDVKKIFDKNYSTKEKPSGYGLYEVKKFIKKNPQSSLTTIINEKEMLLEQKLIIR